MDSQEYIEQSHHKWSSHLRLLIAQHIPAMLKNKLLPLPHLKEQHSPDGHEGSKEDSPSVVKEEACPCRQTLVLQVPKVTPRITYWTHVEGEVSC